MQQFGSWQNMKVKENGRKTSRQRTDFFIDDRHFAGDLSRSDAVSFFFQTNIPHRFVCDNASKQDLNNIIRNLKIRCQKMFLVFTNYLFEMKINIF